ncbi:Ribokinase [Indibacter alkaliphilus LW1]|uniref:Ribokinase n=1 Tax=Indibacter alkaliphilus (strain CCUG 57479 / KCTC 22604 / LW1) TaxID=1189612 RepID=S2DQ60_INDAL|nr:ribokinase [Indibacter alkaliphilus]EOZ91963.1 Ribokinase [Indibacter alkaliphilus LW1]
MPDLPKILVIGSANMDMVIQTSHFPKPGETIIGGHFSLIPGGKGANQAVAAARLGGSVAFITQLGTDVFGNTSLENFKKEGIDTSRIRQNPHQPSGVALITVDGHGENTIIVAPGANNHLREEDIQAAENYFLEASIVLIQLEIPLQVVLASVQMAKKYGKKLILNPAPASQLSAEYYDGLYMITPNETEIELLSGIKIVDERSAKSAAAVLASKGAQHIVITLGASGAYVYSEEFTGILPTEKVKAVDTTAAGDTFNGALAVALGNGRTIKEAVAFALKAATLSVQKLGAQSSIPHLSELK